MPKGIWSVPRPLVAMSTRLCASCGREKTIRGVWYLTPMRSGSTPFVCEACFASSLSAPNVRA